MTALLTPTQTDHARRLAGMPKLVGTLSNGEDFYFNGKFSVEKDHHYLVEPAEDELAEIHQIIKSEIKEERLPPSRGSVAALVIVTVMVAIGIIIYFKYF